VPPIQIYSTGVCPYCVAAKNFLKSRGIGYEEFRIDQDPQRRAEMLARARRTSVPQIFANGTHVGGFDELVAMERSGALKELLEGMA
jgi:glutaredoxin 3